MHGHPAPVTMVLRRYEQEKAVLPFLPRHVIFEAYEPGESAKGEGGLEKVFLESLSSVVHLH